jgi:hypothetical protein
MQTMNPDFWMRCRQLPVQHRVAPAPDELLHHIGQVEGRLPLTEPLRAVPGFIEDLLAALTDLPYPVRALVEGPLLGIFLARGLGCTGIADVVRCGEEVLGVAVVLNVGALEHRTANTWASWKEAKWLKESLAPNLKVRIEEGLGDVRKNAIQFVLLHEFGHVLTAGSGWLPDWWIDPANVLSPHWYPYLALSWTVDPHRQIVPTDSRSRNLCDRLRGTPSRVASSQDVLGLYHALDCTTFTSLYAANNAFDDLAECFALYVHIVLMCRPYQVEFDVFGKTVIVSSATSVAQRCAEKFQFIADFLHSSASREVHAPARVGDGRSGRRSAQPAHHLSQAI